MTIAIPADQYLKEAFAALQKTGVAVQTAEVTEWLTQQFARGVTLADVVSQWHSPENAAIFASAAATSRLTYVTEELDRHVARTATTASELAQTLIRAGADNIVGVAAEKASALLACSVKQRVFAEYARALASAVDRNEPHAETFERVSQNAYRELAGVGSSAAGHSTSWQANVEATIRLVVLSDIAALFLDVAKISSK
jgi:hypothetical protein